MKNVTDNTKINRNPSTLTAGAQGTSNIKVKDSKLISILAGLNDEHMFTCGQLNEGG